jgi:hypothetical protein
VSDSFFLEAAARTDLDPLGSTTRGAFALRRYLGLAVVAAGPPRPAADGTTAAMAVDAIESTLAGAATLGVSDLIGRPVRPLGQLGLAIEQACQRVDAVLGERPDPDAPELSLAAALWRGPSLYVAHVGACRIHRLRAGDLALLSQGADGTTGRGPRPSRRRGWAPEVGVAIETILAGDVVLVATPGVHAALTEPELTTLLRASSPVDAALDALLHRAEAHSASGAKAAILLRWSR